MEGLKMQIKKKMLQKKFEARATGGGIIIIFKVKLLLHRLKYMATNLLKPKLL